MTDILARLAQATPEQKAVLYEHLGIQLTYHPDDRTVLVEARPACATERVGGGT